MHMNVKSVSSGSQIIDMGWPPAHQSLNRNRYKVCQLWACRSFARKFAEGVEPAGPQRFARLRAHAHARVSQQGKEASEPDAAGPHSRPCPLQGWCHGGCPHQQIRGMSLCADTHMPPAKTMGNVPGQWQKPGKVQMGLAEPVSFRTAPGTPRFPAWKRKLLDTGQWLWQTVLIAEPVRIICIWLCVWLPLWPQVPGARHLSWNCLGGCGGRAWPIEKRKKTVFFLCFDAFSGNYIAKTL